MARYIRSQCRLCRTEGVKLMLKGTRCVTAKCAIAKKKTQPGKAPRTKGKKVSDYGIQLREKQKLKRIYGMLEKQFRIFFERAVRQTGKTGENLINMLERRLDNTVFRMRFASSRKQARQLVLHGHVIVNGRRNSIPSYQVRNNDEISIRENSRKLTTVKEALKEYTKSGVVPWLEVDPDGMSGRLKGVPNKGDIAELAHIKEQLIVELYSK